MIGAVCLAWPLLRVVDLSIARLGVRQTYRCMRATSPKPWRPDAISAGLLDRVGRVVRKANRRREAFCLRRALLIWWLLRWFGAESDIYCDSGVDKGHAWVEAYGRVIGDRADYQGTGRFGRFSVLFGSSGPESDSR